MKIPRWLQILWFALILTAWTVRGLPWNLDEYDQAKQAFTSHEMIGEGHWWWQHTPKGASATKPPLVGWASAAIYSATGSWDVAWRLPSLLAAVGLLVLLWKSGQKLAGDLGAFVATGAFAWNLLSIRLATLVRTDMVLTFLIFASGWLIWRRLERGEKWRFSDSLWLTLLLAAGAMTKGPIYHAFLLPGLLAWAWLVTPTRHLRTTADSLAQFPTKVNAPQESVIGGHLSSSAGTRNLGTDSLQESAGSGSAGASPQRLRLLATYAVISLVSVLPFLLWTWLRVQQEPTFYKEVVVKEFLGRFTTGENAVHNNQTLYFYFPHLLAKCAPWSLAALAALGLRSVRQRTRRDPATLWLACWAVGGLLVMSLVPSKRVDRIFPVVPVFALWLAAILPALLEWKPVVRRLALGCCALAALIFLSYTGVSVAAGYRDKLGALVTFGGEVRALVADKKWTSAVIEGRDEGMLLYLGQPRFWSVKEAALALKEDRLQAVVANDRALKALEKSLGKLEHVLTVTHPTDRDAHYILLRKPDSTTP